MDMPFALRRLPCNPIIVPAMLNAADGDNINGPSLIEAPHWLPGRLARFYLYFAHHRGRCIRLAVADRLEGPWRIVEGGSLRLDQAPGCQDHIASPDVHVDEARKQVVMYFHGPAVDWRQELTFVARSGDGIAFQADRDPVAQFYFRAVRWRQYWVGMSKGGLLYLSDDGGAQFLVLHQPAFPRQHPLANAPGDVRHVALKRVGDTLLVFHSRIGDTPECIRLAAIDLARPPADWQAGASVVVLQPAEPWEGADLPVEPSVFGPSRGREHALRDPAVFDVDGQSYLLYATAGESGIGIAQFMSPPGRPRRPSASAPGQPSNPLQETP